MTTDGGGGAAGQGSWPTGPEAWPTDLSLPVLVFQVASNFLTHSSLAIARSAGRVGVPVYGLYADQRAPEARSRYWSGQFPHPPPGASDDQWVEALLSIGRQLGRAALITTDDEATVLAARRGDELRARFAFPQQSLELVRLLADKRRMYELSDRLGIPVPRSEFPTSRHDVVERARSGPFPVVVKRIAAWLPSRAADPGTVTIAHTGEQLLSAYDEMESDREPNVMLQEYVPGGDDTQWIHNGYFDQDSRCLVGFTGRKLRQRGYHNGPATLGECVGNAEVERLTLELVKEVGYQGILDIGFRHDARDGTYKLLDANPRIGSSFRMFVGTNGIDVLRALYLDLNGHPVPATTQREGKWIVEPLDVATAARLWRLRELSGREWLRSVRGIEEWTWFARDDLRPFASMVARSALYGTRRVLAAGR